MSQQPNLLVIMSDQHNPDHMGGLGCPGIQTPTLDHLIARGVTFRNAYCAYPMCTPSRASYMTGRLTTDHQVWELGDPLSSALPTWAHVLRHAGYTTSISGRMHFVGPDKLHGFETRVHPEISDRALYAYGNWDKPQEHQHIMIDGLAHAGPVDGHTAGQAYDEAVTRAAIAEMERLTSDEVDQPWALQVGYFLPHIPFRVSRDWWDVYEGQDVPMPRTPPDGRTWEDCIPPQYHDSRKWLGLTSDGATDEQVYNARRAYFGMISHLDHLIGRLLDKLETLGQLDNTVVVYASDHGDNVGEHGMWSKLNFFEDSVRVPLIVAPPAYAHAGATCDAPVSLIDWMSTVLDLTGEADGFEPLPGQSWLPLLEDPTQTWPDRLVIADYACDGTRVPMRMVRKGKWKASFASGFEAVLYDLEADPHEWHDLGREPSSKPVLKELEAIARADGWDPVALQEPIMRHKRRLDYIGQVDAE